jgi:Zn-dependent protease
VPVIKILVLGVCCGVVFVGVLGKVYKAWFVIGGKACLAMKCKQCGEEAFLPFQCPYCGGQFCSLHRLPENHACAKMEVARSVRQDEVLVSSSPKSYQYSVTIGQPRTAKGRVYFSPREVKHLLVAGLLVMVIGLSSALYPGLFGSVDWLALGVFAVILTGSFFAHEIAHKVMAQKRGLWAEFRLTMWGAVVTLISVISPFFKFISPGAVMVSGSASAKEMGKVSLAGPAVNCFLSVVFFGLALPSSGQYQYFLFFAAFLNGFMALFNLIPVGILDGYKIFSWDKKVWAVIFAASIALTGVAYANLSGWITF